MGILDRFSLEGKNALVTGASAGLGAAIATAFAEAGANVACHGNSRSPDETCAAVVRAGRCALPLTGDLGDRSTPQRLFEETVATFGSLDILVNNAGTIRRAPFLEYSEDDWQSVLDVNLTSIFRLSQLAGRQFIRQGQGGKIVNVASLLSFQGGVTVPAYSASKGGVAQLTKACANELARHDINVNAIAPGYFETDNTLGLRRDETRNRQILERIPAGRWGRPADLAGAAVFLASAASDYMHGHLLVVDGGWLGR